PGWLSMSNPGWLSSSKPRLIALVETTRTKIPGLIGNGARFPRLGAAKVAAVMLDKLDRRVGFPNLSRRAAAPGAV
ncbi:MAG: hypothetical protein KDB51_01755, partial [Propionibacteriaceae bacterium]|nr:hypothetical protein [Propionibacteriaceae bacterium]